MATFTWLGGSGNWTDSNWSISGPSAQSFPTSADIVDVGGTGSYTLSIPAAVGILGHNVTIDDPNAVVKLVGNAFINNALTIASGTVEFANLGAILSASTVTSDGTILSTGLGALSDSLGASAGFTNNGAITIDGDSMALVGLAGNVTNAGTIAVSDFGTLNLSTSVMFTNSGLITLGTGATVDIISGTAAPAVSGDIRFTDNSGAILNIGEAPQQFNATVEGFQIGDTIDFFGYLQVSAIGSVDLNSGTIDVSYNGFPSVLEIPTDLPADTPLVVSNDGKGYAQITIACFAEGTRLLTPSGEVPIQELRVGGLMTTCSGRIVRIRWLGHRHIDCRQASRPLDILPVRIEADAFGPGVPLRELRLSPDHSVFIRDGADGALVPVRYLLNGSTIAQVSVDDVTYWHVELDRHDIVLADGLPTESYLDTGNRDVFSDAGRPIDIASVFLATEACAVQHADISGRFR